MLKRTKLKMNSLISLLIKDIYHNKRVKKIYCTKKVGNNYKVVTCISSVFDVIVF